MIHLQKGFDIAKGLVLSGYIHPDHERTVDLARTYKALITGEDLEFLLRRFDRRESEKDFEQANRIAQQITPAITAALMNPARRLGSVIPKVDRMDYGDDNDPKADALREEMEKFATVGIDQYLSSTVDPSDADPNGFVILTFDDFDARYEKPIVYPVLIPCENVYAAPRINNDLQYLYLGFKIRYVEQPAVIGQDGTVITPAVTKEGMRYVMYIDNHHVVFEQVKKDAAQAPIVGQLYTQTGEPVTINRDAGVAFSKGAEQTPYYFRKDKETLFQVTFYDQMSGMVPCYALGCKPDPLTDGRTFVNRWHDGLAYLKKSLKQVRELDLTTALHAFPQKIQCIARCTGKHCNKGYMPDGKECDTCKGSGFQTIGSAQDHITIPFPQDPKDALDLTKIVHYVPVPVDLIQQLRDIVKDTRSDAFRAVYGYDLHTSGNVGKTIEEAMEMKKAMYDALSPLAFWRERTRILIVKVYAGYNDVDEGLIVVYKYPKDYGLDTDAQIMQMMKLASEAGAPTDYLAALSDKLITATFSDDEQALARVKTHARFDPYPGLSEDAVLTIISGGKALEKSALRWTEKATIFALCEAEASGPVGFYELTDKKQAEIYNKVVDQLLEEMQATAEPIAMPVTGVENTEDQEEEDRGASDTPPEQPAAAA